MWKKYKCKKCGAILGVHGYVYGIVICDECNHYNWVEAEESK